MISYRGTETGRYGDNAVLAVAAALRSRGYTVFDTLDTLVGGDLWCAISMPTLMDVICCGQRISLLTAAGVRLSLQARPYTSGCYKFESSGGDVLTNVWSVNMDQTRACSGRQPAHAHRASLAQRALAAASRHHLSDGMPRAGFSVIC